MKAALLLCLFAALFNCQKSASPEAGIDPVDLLPADNDISGFTRKGSPAVMTDYQSIYDAIDGAATTYLDYGFQDGVQQMFSNGSAVIDVQIFNQGSEANAVGLYEEFYPSAGEVLLGEDPRMVVDHASISAYTLQYQRKSFFVRINTTEKTDFMLNMAKQFSFNIDSKIQTE